MVGPLLNLPLWRNEQKGEERVGWGECGVIFKTIGGYYIWATKYDDFKFQILSKLEQ